MSSGSRDDGPAGAQVHRVERFTDSRGGTMLNAHRILLVVVIVSLLGLPASSATALPNEEVAENFELVGHHALFNRGMNAAIAVHGDHVYVGNRTDGSPHHPHPGVLIVDVSDPSAPEVVGEIGQPHEGNVGETSRELRVWPQQDLLMVLNFGCSSAIHACSGGEFRGSNVKFYDISGDKAAAPELVATYEPSRTPHEFFLWVDPHRPEERALLFQSTPTSSTSNPNIIVADISAAPDGGEIPEVAEWVADFEAGTTEDGGEEEDRRLHSLGISNDGTRAYLAFLGAGFLILDASDVVDRDDSTDITYLTPPENRVNWTNPGAHSAIKLWGQDAALTTDEVYGEALEALPGNWGCPWGWARTIDISDPTAPAVVGEYRAEENTAEYCQTTEGQDPSNTTFTSYSAHNPTVTPNVAFVTWHSAGLHAFSVDDPENPQTTGIYDPEPLTFVHTEDPMLNLGRDKTTMWTYPIIQDGLIYVADIRNGLYILRYTGPHADEVEQIGFLEGNSNLGDALRFEPVTGEGQGSPSAPADGSQAPAPDREQDGRGAPLPATGGGAGLLAVTVLLAGALVRRRRRPS
ncbi:MAG: hypothetical protein KY437_01165 [Actinobacteria bacterium]|nr:hypothetical protein [Actinomycetota bacterium]